LNRFLPLILAFLDLHFDQYFPPAQKSEELTSFYVATIT
jgi:hypothetical protein